MKKFKEFWFSLIYFFGQSIQYVNIQRSYFIAGNFNAFYFGAVMQIYQNRKRKELLKKLFIPYIAALIYIIVQLLVNNELNIVRAFINITKIFVCFLLMLYVKNNYKKISLIKVAKIVSIMSSIMLVISLILRNTILWRHNDYINKFDLDRLQYLFLEPSELGFYLMIIEIVLFAYFLYSKFKDKMIILVLLITNFVTIYLTKSIGTIVIGVIALAGVFVWWLIYNFKQIIKTRQIYYCLGGIVLAIVAGLLLFKGSIGKRLDSVKSGSDFSVNYRLSVSKKVTQDVLKDTYFFGIGYGNLELKYKDYEHYGLTASGIVSSFFNFLAEGGILSIYVLFILIYYLIKNCIISKSILKWGFLIFILCFQVVGSYFTNPLCWIIYGIIISTFDEKNI